MKIIINEKKYVQVRDILFLAKLYNSEILMKYYLFLINSGYIDNDFVRSTNSLLNRILDTDALIDFRDYQDYSDLHLSNLLISLSSRVGSDIIEHKLDDLREIISYKRRELGYAIPLIPDEKIDIKYDNLGLSFKSTIFKDYYLIETISGEEIGERDYREALRRGLSLIGCSLDGNYNLINKGSYIVICLTSEEKKKEKKDNIINKLARKFKNRA